MELLTERCTLGLRNDAHLKARRRYPLPKVPATRTPQLDGFIKGEVSTATRNADKELTRLQSLVLDSLAPLIHLLEAEQRGGPPMWEEAKKAVVAATELVGQCQCQDDPPQEGEGHNRPEQGAASSCQGGNQLPDCPTLIVWHGVCQEGQGLYRPARWRIP